MELWDKFVETVAIEFGFLETEFDFARTMTKQPNIIYASDSLQVQIYYDADGRYELDLGIRRLADDPRKPLSLSVQFLMRLNRGNETCPTMFPSTREELEANVKRLAELLRVYGSVVLSGDLRDFEELEQFEHQLAIKYGTPR